MENIGRELKRLLKKHKVSIYKVAEDFGVAHESLYRSLKNGANPEWKRTKQILDYLGYDLKFVKRRKAKPNKPLKSKRKGVTK
jgi:DNA-binding phage protein